MKLILAVLLLALASGCASNAPVVSSSKNYHSRFDAQGSDNNPGNFPRATDERLGGADSGS